MPYEKMSDLPDHIKKMPAKKKRTWMAAFNSAYEQWDPKKDKKRDPKRTPAENREAYAFRVANAAIQETVALARQHLTEVVRGPFLVSSALRSGALTEAKAFRGSYCIWCGSRRGKGHRHLAKQSGGAAEHPDGNGGRSYAESVDRPAKTPSVQEAMRAVLAGAPLATLVRAAVDEETEDHPFSVIERAVREAVRKKYQAIAGYGQPSMECWVVEVFLDRAIVSMDGKLYAVPFIFSDDTMEAAMGEPELVKVEYTPVGS